MLKIIAEQEHYVLVSDGLHFTVLERCADKFYPLCNGLRHGADLDDETVVELIRRSGAFSEKDARKRLAQVAAQWRDLYEHVR